MNVLSAAILIFLVLVPTQILAADIRPAESPPMPAVSSYSSGGVNGTSKACVLEGVIEVGDATRIAEAIGTRTTGFEPISCELLFLHSPGGSFNEAVEIMEFVHESMITTAVRSDDVCLSACAIIWLGGAYPWGHGMDNPHSDRRLWPGGTIGFHAPYPQLKSGTSYSSDEVLRAFLGAFTLSQELLDVFQSRRIPLWFASRLMHPEVSGFFFIDDIESATLVGANMMVDGDFERLATHQERATACYNMSHWSKGLSAKGRNIAEYSRNISRYRSLEEYLAHFQKNQLAQLGGKYIMSLEIELRDAGLITADFYRNLHAITNENVGMDRLWRVADVDGARGYIQELAVMLGPQFSYEAPGTLLHLQSKADYASQTWRLFNGPGVVGPDDENTRDRSEICIIVEGYDGSRVTGSDIEDELSDRLSWGPRSLVGLPAGTRLANLRAPGTAP